MAKKTNKTSHVLNLLTNHTPGEDTDNAGMEKKSDVSTIPAASAKVTVVDEGSRNDRVSQEILSHLSEELELEVPELEEIPEELPQNAPEVLEEPSPAVSEEETVSAAVPEDTNTVSQPETASVIKQSHRLVDQLKDR